VRRFVLSENGTKVSFSQPDPVLAAQSKIDWNDMSKYVPLECKKGTMVLIHGHVVHMSHDNTSNVSRHAYTWHMMDASSKYSNDNWLQRPQEAPFEPL